MMLIWLARKQQESQLSFMTSASLVGLYLLLIFIAGRWDITGFWLRYIWIILLIGLLLFRLTKHRNYPLFDVAGIKAGISFSVKIAVILSMAFAIWQVRNNNTFKGEVVELAHPLKLPFWYVIHGGSNGFMNPHRHVRAQEYAVDMTTLNLLGLRAIGLIPSDLTKYSAYGAEVTAPCNGRVIATENTLPDLNPLEMDSVNLAGNHVTISCKGVVVMLAHLMHGSITVDFDAEIEVGDIIGRIGNGGNSTEPHLHIHAIREPPHGLSDLDEILFSGEAVPIIFNREFLTRNSVGNYLKAFHR